MAKFIDALNSTSLRKPSSGYVLWYCGTLLVHNKRSLFRTRSQARSSLSQIISQAYNLTPSLYKEFSSVGEFREYLESNQIVIVKDANNLGDISFRE